MLVETALWSYGRAMLDWNICPDGGADAQAREPLCAQDCPASKGEVMSQFGTRNVDFMAVFTRLKLAGFHGPIMVEGVKVGGTAGVTTANVPGNREILEMLFASV